MTTFIAPNLYSGIGDELLAILGLALVGGLVLNLMPCVLPVLAVKLLGVVSKGGRSRRDVRLGFLGSSAGILFTFLVLGAAIIAAKAAGSAVGWGVQFQQPLFLVALALLCALFAGNLWGLFEIRLPVMAGNIVARDQDHSFAGDFLSGVFATVLATPCSAPSSVPPSASPWQAVQLMSSQSSSRSVSAWRCPICWSPCFLLSPIDYRVPADG
jgi:suppressor for copper-sensitivity B